MRFTIHEENVDDVGECWRINDAEGEFGDWYSLVKQDIIHLTNFLNKQEDNINALTDLNNQELEEYHMKVLSIIDDEIMRNEDFIKNSLPEEDTNIIVYQLRMLKRLRVQILELL